MITESTSPLLRIDWGNDEPGMTLQREYREDGSLAWRDVVKAGQVVKSLVDIDSLPFGVYQLVN